MEGEEEGGDGGFAAARGVDEGGCCAGLEGEGEGGEDGGCGSGWVGEGCVVEDDGAGMGKADVARVLVRAFVGEECQAEEAGRGVPAGVHLGDKSYDAVCLGYAKEEHCEYGQDTIDGV